MNDLPPFVRAERDSLLKEIESAFDGVTRAGGVSWQEAEIADNYGSPRAVERVRGKDTDTRWQDLLDEESDFQESGIGYWPFLDAIGFRYYLLAAMVWSVRLGHDVMIAFPLTSHGTGHGWPGDRWTLLNLRQRRCVKRFLWYMDVVEACTWWTQNWASSSEWRQALDWYWKDIPDEDDPMASRP